MIGLIKGTARQVKSVSGLPLPIASYNENLKAPIKKLSLSINPTQSGSGDPAPDNIRPITGVSSVDVMRTGVNQWDEQWETGDISNTTGQTVPSGVYFRSKNYCACFPSTNYSCSLGSMRIFWYDENNAFISNTSIDYAGMVFSSPSNARYFKIKRYGTSYGNNISINYPSTDTSYHAYQGNTYTISLGDTCYGGRIDIVDGEAVMTCDVGYKLLTGADDESWGLYNTYNGFYLTSIGMASGTTLNGLCSHFRSNVEWSSLGLRFGAGNSYVYFLQMKQYVSGVTDLATWKTWLSNNNVQLVYPLATPFTVNLGSVSIPSLLGQNNIWHDGNGDVDELVYQNRQLYYGR